MYPFSPKLASHPGCCITLSRVPGAVQFPVGYPFKYSRVYLSTANSPTLRGCHLDGFTFLCCVDACLSLGDFQQLFKVPGYVYSCRLLTWSFSLSQEHFAVVALLPPSPSASDSFPVSWLFASGGQMIGAPASASVLPMNIQD